MALLRVKTATVLEKSLVFLTLLLYYLDLRYSVDSI